MKNILLGGLAVIVLVGGYFALKSSSSSVAVNQVASESQTAAPIKASDLGLTIEYSGLGNVNCRVGSGDHWLKGVSYTSTANPPVTYCVVSGTKFYSINKNNPTDLGIVLDKKTDQTNFLDWAAYKGYGCFKTLGELYAYLKNNPGKNVEMQVKFAGDNSDASATATTNVGLKDSTGKVVYTPKYAWTGASASNKCKFGGNTTVGTGSGVENSNATASGTASSGVTATATTSKSGQITKLQTLLRDAGFYTGKIDGVNNQATKDALKKFQASVGL